MKSIASYLPGLLDHLEPGKPPSPWPVWRNSSTGEFRFMPVAKATVARWRHTAKRWHRQARTLGLAALAVYEALAFEFLNFKTGRLDPSLDAIAAKAGICRRSVVTALKRLRDHGIVTWQRRCRDIYDSEGRHRLEQDTNAYTLLPPSQWHGWREPPPIPPPEPGTWGDHPPLPEDIEAAAIALQNGDRQTAFSILDGSDNPLARSFGRLGRAIETETFPGVQALPRNRTQSLIK